MRRLAVDEPNVLRVVHSDQPLPTRVTQTLFLAGPTPRDGSPSWRQEALNELHALGYRGTVLVPEPTRGRPWPDHEAQVAWELAAMAQADVLVFWVPRDLTTLPGFTTNVEFGYWVRSGRVALGCPPNAPHTAYLRVLAQRQEVPCATTLVATLQQALTLLGPGATRVGGEAQVPLLVWRTPSFQQWYTTQRDAGNHLDHAELLWVWRTGPQHNVVFMWIMQVHVYVAAEDRVKANEFVVARTDATAVCLYLPHADPLDTEVVLVREFRSPASTPDGFILELPGGSSFRETADMRAVAAAELQEELGFTLTPDRLRTCHARQLAGTLLANRTHLYAAVLTPAELAWFKTQVGVMHGNVADTEQTYVEVQRVRELLAGQAVDWGNLGMITEALRTHGEEAQA